MIFRTKVHDLGILW